MTMTMTSPTSKSRIRVLPYKQGSRSAKLLSETLGPSSKVLKLANSTYQPNPQTDVVINWGSSSLPSSIAGTAALAVLNRDTSIASCKLKTFEAFSTLGDYFTSINEAILPYENNVSFPKFWLEGPDIPDSEFPVVCRTVLNGHSGQGIVIANTREELVEAPLYTKLIKKKDEYRVHVVLGETIFIQRKARKHSCPNPNWVVRNLAGGFAFVEASAESVPPCVIQEAELAIIALGLDFGGVDVIYNETQNKAYVLEVNTACGLEQRTANKYAEAFLKVLNRE